MFLANINPLLKFSCLKLFRTGDLLQQVRYKVKKPLKNNDLKPKKPDICKQLQIPLTRREKCLKCPEVKIKVPCGVKEAKNPPICEGNPCISRKKFKTKKQMTYIKSWNDFEKAGERLYLQNPTKARYVMKYCHQKGLLNLKLTDDVQCLQYKTEIQQDVRKIEKFLSNLMKHMASKDD